LHTGFYARFKFALIGKKGLAKEGFSNRNLRLCGMVSLQFTLRRASGNAHKTQNSLTQNKWYNRHRNKADLADRGKT
jgi:hypothetical protein